MVVEYGLDLFRILVEAVFGSIALSLIGWGVIILITGIMGRMSFQSILIILLTYGMAASIGYIGALAALPLSIASIYYMTTGILNRLNETR